MGKNEIDCSGISIGDIAELPDKEETCFGDLRKSLDRWVFNHSDSNPHPVTINRLNEVIIKHPDGSVMEFLFQEKNFDGDHPNFVNASFSIRNKAGELECMSSWTFQMTPWSEPENPPMYTRTNSCNKGVSTWKDATDELVSDFTHYIKW